MRLFSSDVHTCVWKTDSIRNKRSNKIEERKEKEGMKANDPVSNIAKCSEWKKLYSTTNKVYFDFCVSFFLFHVAQQLQTGWAAKSEREKERWDWNCWERKKFNLHFLRSNLFGNCFTDDSDYHGELMIFDNTLFIYFSQSRAYHIACNFRNIMNNLEFCIVVYMHTRVASIWFDCQKNGYTCTLKREQRMTDEQWHTRHFS